MGICFSAATGIDQPTAKVICVDGSLIEYLVPVNVSRVLGLNYLSSFLCNSDSLCYDSYVSALHPAGFIELGQLYFMLPIDKLQNVLSGPDMAALAVKASCALANVAKNRKERGASARVMPLPEVDGDYSEYMRFNEDSVGMPNSRPKPLLWKKMQKTDPLSTQTLHRQKLSTIKEVAE